MTFIEMFGGEGAGGVVYNMPQWCEAKSLK